MSLHPEPLAPIPEEAARIARAAFPKGNAYMQMHDVLGTIYTDQQFTALFAPRGYPAEAPWRLVPVTVMQFAERLSDRQAAEAVRARIDWKYALSLELTDPGFDFSILSEFRRRLVCGAAELLLDAVLAACPRAKGHAPAAAQIETPYELEARYGEKRGQPWIGYKVHLTETRAEDAPHLITQVIATIATAADVEQLATIQQGLAAHDLLPAEHLVDAGYVRGRILATSRDTYHRRSGAGGP